MRQLPTLNTRWPRPPTRARAHGTRTARALRSGTPTRTPAGARRATVLQSGRDGASRGAKRRESPNRGSANAGPADLLVGEPLTAKAQPFITRPGSALVVA